MSRRVLFAVGVSIAMLFPLSWMNGHSHHQSGPTLSLSVCLLSPRTAIHLSSSPLLVREAIVFSLAQLWEVGADEVRVQWVANLFAVGQGDKAKEVSLHEL